MDFKVIINEDAYLDLLDVVDFYESKSVGLGENFFKIYKEKVFELNKNPFYFSFYMEQFRRISFEYFPYVMIYKILDNNTVIIFEITFAGRSNETIIRKPKGN